jgi:molecular chaperone GrpE
MAKKPKEEKNLNPSEGEQNAAEDGDIEQTMVALTYDEYDALEGQIDQLQKDLDDTKDSWLRCRADFDNYKKRVQRDAQRSHQDAMASILKIFLSASDDLERALKNEPDSAHLESWINGIELILQKLNTQMKNQGVERMNVKPGDEFDPNIHEAITQEPNPDFEEGQIIDVVQPGYKIADRIIRPAMVRVAQ